ncbi:hypothetical protein Buap_1290 [Buchnera aphidicola str. APS (Acyrthosiphon pisum)]
MPTTKREYTNDCVIKDVNQDSINSHYFIGFFILKLNFYVNVLYFIFFLKQPQENILNLFFLILWK